MTLLFGETRTHIDRDHALIGIDSHVTSPLVGWTDVEGVILISPAMRGGAGGPRFVQYLVDSKDKIGRSTGAAAGVERLVYVLKGSAKLDGRQLDTNHFAYFPPNDIYELGVDRETTLLVFEKQYEPLDGVPIPKRQFGSLGDRPSESFLGDPAAQLATLLPVEPAFDMAVNVFTYQPGAMLPFVECHVMEHGLYMKQGQGVYRLGDRWYPVQQGDAIWMASYCPQWFVAMGKQPAAYIYYKDIHRDPLSPILQQAQGPDN
jgi:(S)-ureidoglycine aminohydrolase